MLYSPTRFTPDKKASNEQRILKAVEYVAESIDDMKQRIANLEQKVSTGRAKGFLE